MILLKVVDKKETSDHNQTIGLLCSIRCNLRVKFFFPLTDKIEFEERSFLFFLPLDQHGITVAILAVFKFILLTTEEKILLKNL